MTPSSQINPDFLRSFSTRDRQPVIKECPLVAGAYFHRPGVTPFHLYTGKRFPPVRIRGDRPDEDSTDREEFYEVRIIDNDYNTYQEVMEITMLALNIGLEEAYAVAWEVDHRVSCVVAHAPREEAERIANIIRTIGIEVQVNPLPRKNWI